MKDDGGDAEREVMLAEQALGGGRFDDAEAHLARAKDLGLHEAALDRLQSAIKGERSRQAARRNWSVPAGICAAGACYALLAIRQPLGWTIPLWIVFAFAVIPALAGLVTSTMAGPRIAAGNRFRAGAAAGALAMAAYTGLSLVVVHGRISSATAPGAADAVLRVGFVVTVLYAAAAGLVAGLAAGVAGRRSGVEVRP